MGKKKKRIKPMNFLYNFFFTLLDLKQTFSFGFMWKNLLAFAAQRLLENSFFMLYKLS